MTALLAAFALLGPAQEPREPMPSPKPLVADVTSWQKAYVAVLVGVVVFIWVKEKL